MDYPVRIPGQLRAYLRSLRKARGWTQAQLGERVGLGQARIALIEKNPSAVSVRLLFKLLAALGAELVLRDGGASPETSAATESEESW